jgi:uncharacterized membrane protein YkoI
MKKLLFIAILGIFGAYAAQAQDDNKMKVKDKDVPQAVKSAFESQFANASDVEWKVKNGKYKAKFDMNGVEQFAELNNSGEVVSKGTKIPNEELPTLVSDAVKSNYASNKVDEVYRVEKGGQTHYMVKLDGNPEKKLVYDAQGKLVKEKMHKD